MVEMGRFTSLMAVMMMQDVLVFCIVDAIDKLAKIR